MPTRPASLYAGSRPPHAAGPTHPALPPASGGPTHPARLSDAAPPPHTPARAGAGSKPVTGRAGALAAGRAAAAALQAATLILAARSAGAERFGVAVAVIGVLTFAYTIADLGVNTSLLKTVAADPADTAIGAMLRVKRATSLGATVLLGLLLLIPPAASINLGDRIAAGLFAGWALLEMWTDTAFVLSLARGRERAAVTTLLIRRGVPLLALVPLARLLPVERALALSLLLGGLCAVLASTAAIRGLPVRPSPTADLRAILTRTRPFWLTGLSAQLAQLGPALVGLVAGAAAAGAFGAPNRLTGPLIILPASLSNVALVNASCSPRGSRAHRRTIYRATAGLAGACAAVFATISVVAGPVCRLLLGTEFLAAIGPLRILLAAFALICVTQPLAAMLQGEGRERPVSRLLVGVSVSGLGLILLGARLNGADGAAWGVFVMQAVALVGVLSLIRWEPAAPVRQAERTKRPSTARTRPELLS